LEMTIEPADRDWFRLELTDAWLAAQEEATSACDYWRERPGPTGYAVYRAAQDRADQAQDVLASELQDGPGAGVGINRDYRRLQTHSGSAAPTGMSDLR
jgi:hypothetical protein